MAKPLFCTLDDIKQFWGINNPEEFVKDIPSRGCYGRRDNLVYSRYDIEKKIKNGKS